MRIVAAIIALLAGAAGCAHTAGAYVWVDSFPAPADTAATYRIRAGDLIAVRVWDHEEMSVRGRVRTDGRITLPLVDEVEVAGRSPEEVARAVEERLGQRKLVRDPRVTVLLEEPRPLSVAVLGEVARAGMYTLESGAGVAEALASAGGLTEFADRDRIFVIRRSPAPVRVRFTYRALAEARGQAATFRLQPGDVVVAQ
jgi:polysaccharide export outer membrane protein